MSIQNTIRETVRYWSELKIDDQALRTRLGDKVERVFEYRRLQAELQRAESDLEKNFTSLLAQRLLTDLTFLSLEPTRIALQKRIRGLEEKLEDPAQQTPENKQALETAKAGVQEIISRLKPTVSLITEQMQKGLQPLRDQVETTGLVQIEGQVPVQKGFFKTWVTPALNYLPNPFARRSKEPSDAQTDAQKFMAAQQAEIAMLRAELSKKQEYEKSKYSSPTSSESEEQEHKTPEEVIEQLRSELSSPKKSRYPTFFIDNLASFKIKPLRKETTETIKLFEKISNPTEPSEVEIVASIQLAHRMGCQALEEVDILPSEHSELKDQTSIELFQNKDCYVSYFLQKAKNYLSCWKVEKDFVGLSDDVIGLAERLSEDLTQRAERYGITLTPDYTLPSIVNQETSDKDPV